MTIKPFFFFFNLFIILLFVNQVSVDERTWLAILLKFNRIAKTGVLGNPLNKLEPRCPGRKSFSLQGNSSHAMIKSAGSDPLGNNKGQYGAEGHWGTISVPLALVSWACLITLGIR